MRYDSIAADQSLPVHTLPLEVAVVVPTLNEVANVEKLIAKLSIVLAGRGWEVVFVDDNSPDGSPEFLRSFAEKDPQIIPLIRPQKAGYGGAVCSARHTTPKPPTPIFSTSV